MCLREMGLLGMPTADVVVECAKRGVPEPVATVVNHVTPHRGDWRMFWDRGNWEPLCKRHHDSDAQRRDGSGGQRNRIGPDGRPVGSMDDR